jgi:hypothetical protein
VRSEIWGNSIEDYNIGDRLICKKPLFRVNPVNGKLEIKIANSTEFEVWEKPLLDSLAIAGTKYNYNKVKVLDCERNLFVAFILTTASSKLRDAELKRLSTEARESKVNSHRSALWQSFYLLQQTFDDIAFSYAITTHKSQGSTYDSVYIDLPDLMKSPDLKTIVYTALTRSKKVYIYE